MLNTETMRRVRAMFVHAAFTFSVSMLNLADFPVSENIPIFWYMKFHFLISEIRVDFLYTNFWYQKIMF